jgi:hypothetical protein
MTTNASFLAEVIPGIGRGLGIAFANPNSTTNTLTVTLYDAGGVAIGSPATVNVPPQGTAARFVSELFSSNALGGGVRGSVSVQSSTAFAVMGMRFTGTQFSVSPANLIATVAGVPTRVLTSGSASNTPQAGTIGGPSAILVPQFVMSGGWATELGLMNNGSSGMTGRVDIFDTSGTPLAVNLNGANQSTFGYSIPANGSFVLGPRDTAGQLPF